MEKVLIIGSGNVGVAAAFYLAEKGIEKKIAVLVFLMSSLKELYW